MSRFRSNYGVIGAKATNYLYNQPRGMVDVTGLGLFNSKFLIEIYCWGAGGGGGQPGGWGQGAPGGAGGAAFGILPLSASTAFSVMVGGPGVTNGTTSPAGGGGPVIGGGDNRYGASGGGLSGLFLNTYTQANALVIAGGGGGGGSSRAGTGNQGGAGGGTNGENGYSPYDGKTNFQGQGGTQTAAGGVINNSSSGQGALQGGTCTAGSGYGGGGGGGYWGGSAGGYSESNTMSGGGGGSGYLSPTLVGGLLSAGVATTPGDSGNALRGSYGNAGAVSSTGTQGVVIIRYVGLQRGTGGTVTTVGNYTVHTFTTTGSNTFNMFL
jgi:hypothetical protein